MGARKRFGLSPRVQYSSLLILFSVMLYGYTNMQRVAAGYFDNWFWITMNTSAYLLFWAVMTGLVLAWLVPKRK